MRSIKTITSILAFCLIITACVGQEKTEERKVTGYSGVSVSEGIKVELTLGDKEFVEVTAGENYIDRVITEVKDDVLKIRISGNNWNSSNKNILVKVTAKTINTIKASSGASLVTQNLIESSSLKMASSSGANLKVAFKAPNASCEASSGANAKLKGSAKNFKVSASSGSGISAMDVKAIKVKAKVSSGANIKIHVEEELEADASSGGSIKYSGSPTIVDVDKSSGGSIRKAD